jgi:predicted O-methyltransferase YrrM
MRSNLGSIRRPPVRVLSLHAQRVASRGPLNRYQIRKMSRDVDPRVRRFAEILASERSAVHSAQIDDIERHREHLAGGYSASRYGLSQSRMEALAMVASKSPRWAGLIFDIVIALRPTRVLEMGTAIGISGAYIAAGLVANDHGELVTIEYNSKSYEVARDTFSDLDLDQRVTLVHGTFEDALETLMDSEPSFDLVFKDGEHSESATTRWFDSLAPRLASPSAFLLDDIRRDAGMKRAWDQVRRDPQVAASINFYGMGLLILSPQEGIPARTYNFGIR